MKPLEYLEKIGWPHRECDDGEIAIKCPWCGYEALDKSCSINNDNTWGKCHHAGRCDKGGFNLYELRKKTGDDTLKADRSMDKTGPVRNYKKANQEAPPKTEKAKEAVFRFFADRGLDPVKVAETKLVQAGVVRGSNAACFVYSENGKVVDRKFRKESGDNDGWKNFERESDCPSLFGLPLVDPSLRMLTITGGEMDTLAAMQSGMPNPVNGPSETDFGWIDRLWDWLQGFDTFYIATDWDDAGNKAAWHIANRLGSEKCHRIQGPPSCKDVCDAVASKAWDHATMRKALANAVDFKPGKLEHLSAYVDSIFATPKADVYGDLSPYAKLNDALKGFRGGEMTLWAADDKAGKTTILCNLELNWAASSVSVCTGSFELSPVRRGRWLADMMGRGDVDEECLKSTMRTLPLWVIDHVGSIDPKELIDMYVFAAKRYGCKQFVTDSLTLIGIKEDDWAAQAEFVKAIKHRLVAPLQVHHHLVNHTRKGKTDKDNRSKSDSRGNAIVKAIHDNMIMIYREGDLTTLDLKNNREYGKQVKFNLRFDSASRTFTEV
jgi:twinkle protein